MTWRNDKTQHDNNFNNKTPQEPNKDYFMMHSDFRSPQIYFSLQNFVKKK